LAAILLGLVIILLPKGRALARFSPALNLR
jgi:hypothetical protein